MLAGADDGAEAVFGWASSDSGPSDCETIDTGSSFRLLFSRAGLPAFMFDSAPVVLGALLGSIRLRIHSMAFVGP